MKLGNNYNQFNYSIVDRLRKIPSIAQTILAILYDVGEGTIKSFFPHPYSHLFCSHKQKRSFQIAAKRIADSGLVIKNSSHIFTLTKKGEKEAFLAFINAEASSYKLSANKKQKWDGKWRIIFFDIPEKKRSHRDYLRSLLKIIGFKELQKSIWIYPYKIPGFLTEILKDENLLPYVRFITTRDIDKDYDVRKTFSL